MSIGTIVKQERGVVHVASTATVVAIAELLHEHRIGAVLVIDSGDIAGIVSERDIVAGLHALGAGVLAATAADIMSAPVVTVGPHESVAGAMATMTNRRIRHLPVVVDGALVGLVSIGDLVKQRIEEAEQEALALKTYIATA